MNYNPDPSGGYVRSFHLPNTCGIVDSFGVSQSWDASHICWDHGTNMGFVKGCSPAAMGYWDSSDLPFYYGMASQFPIGDRYFCSVMAQTYPNRRFLMAATALGDVATDVSGISRKLPPNGTIFETLDDNGISWTNYYPDFPSCLLFAPVASSAKPGQLKGIDEFETDCARGELAQFNLVDPYVDHSEESGDISIGEAYAARIISAVMKSPLWPKTALIWTYDEHGGWYDHVPPVPMARPDAVPPEIHVPPDQPGAYDYSGFRVPCCVVSAWARRDFVSHTVYDHTSILKLVETKWNLPALTYRDANARPMTDFFDFSAPEPPFAEPPILPAPKNPFAAGKPLPSSDLSPQPGWFHPICTAAPMPAGYLSPTKPAKADALLAAHTRAVMARPRSAPAPHSSGAPVSSSSSATPAIIGGAVAAAVVGGGGTWAIRRRARSTSASTRDSPDPPT